MSRYCLIAPGHPVHRDYHALEYGFHATDEAVLFERLVLEIMQAGLSWELVLKRRAGMRSALAGYDVDAIAAFGPDDTSRLLADPAMIRNGLKIAAVIENARRVRHLRESHGGFAAWLDAHHPREKAEWVKLFKKQFKFCGGEIVGEFLMSLGYLPGAHSADCPVAAQIVDAPWQRQPHPGASGQTGTSGQTGSSAPGMRGA